MLQPLKLYLHFNFSHTTKEEWACFCLLASWLGERNWGTSKGAAFVWPGFVELEETIFVSKLESLCFSLSVSQGSCWGGKFWLLWDIWWGFLVLGFFKGEKREITFLFLTAAYWINYRGNCRITVVQNKKFKYENCGFNIVGGKDRVRGGRKWGVLETVKMQQGKDLESEWVSDTVMGKSVPASYLCIYQRFISILCVNIIKMMK